MGHRCLQEVSLRISMDLPNPLSLLPAKICVYSIYLIYTTKCIYTSHTFVGVFLQEFNHSLFALCLTDLAIFHELSETGLTVCSYTPRVHRVHQLITLMYDQIRTLQQIKNTALLINRLVICKILVLFYSFFGLKWPVRLFTL